MPVLRGTERPPPGAVESPILHKNVNDGKRRDLIESYEERLRVYENYITTPEGQAALALIEPERKRIDYEMMLTPRDLGMTVDEANWHKAMLTGERRVWTRLLLESDLLKSEVKRLEGGEEERDEGPKWKKMPKFLLDKFGGKAVDSQPTNEASTS